MRPLASHVICEIHIFGQKMQNKSETATFALPIFAIDHVTTKNDNTWSLCFLWTSLKSAKMCPIIKKSKFDLGENRASIFNTTDEKQKLVPKIKNDVSNSKSSCDIQLCIFVDFLSTNDAPQYFQNVGFLFTNHG